MKSLKDTENVIIIGSGPAGYTAAIYCSRARLSPLQIEGDFTGGQLMLTTDIENFPGFPEPLMGSSLISAMKKQAEKFGTRFISKNVTDIDVSHHPFKVFIGKDFFETLSIIIATGAEAKWLDIESEKKFRGKGVSACATCDGAFFKNEKVVVIGGGDSAMEEAIFLTRFASLVTIIHRRTEFRASKIMLERARQNQKIVFLTPYVVEKVLGDELVNGVLLRNVQTNENMKIDCSGVFVAIGHKPNTEFLKDKIELDNNGYIVLRKRPLTETNIKGIFACGDVQDHIYKQAITAAGSGCQAAIDAQRYLEYLKKEG